MIFWVYRIYGEDYLKIINQTKVNLNIHHPTDLRAEAYNMWVFEIAGCSGFILTERMSTLESIFKNIEMYSNLDELDEKIEYYVEDDKVREEIDYNLQQQCVSRVRPSSWLLITRPYHSFSITTPRCGRKIREVDYSWFECVCGYENDRDVIAIVNLNGRGVSGPLICPPDES